MDGENLKDLSVLFVTYHYPPDSQIGGKRVARLARYLDGKGCATGVLTVKEKYYERRDDSYAVTLPVYRTSMFQNVRFLLGGIKKNIRKLTGSAGVDDSQAPPPQGPDSAGSKVPAQQASSPPGSESAPQGGSSGLIGALKRLFYGLIWLPDDRQGWVPFGFFKCMKLKRTYRVIYSSGPPHSVHLIPLLVSYFSRRLVWIAEFRDPWMTIPKPGYARTRFTVWLENSMEAAVMRRSSRIVVVTEAMKKNFVLKYPRYEEKIKVYYNGFDEDEFVSVRIEEKDESGKSVFAYAGQFDYGRDPKTLMHAVSELIAEGALDRDGILVNLMGDTHTGGGADR